MTEDAVRRPNIKLLEGVGHLPIHAQITNNLRHAISTGQLPPETQLPSVRDLADELNVAMNTVARAYQALQEEELVVVYPGRGTFVAHLIEQTSLGTASTSQAALIEILAPAIQAVLALGVSADEILHVVRRLLTADTLMVGLVGINPLVVQKWSAIVAREYHDLEMKVIGITIEAMRNDLAGVLKKLEPATFVFSLVTTYAETRQLLQDHNKRTVPLLTEVSMATHEALAKLPGDRCIGLVAEDYYVNNLLALIGNYCDLQLVRVVSPDNEPAVRDLMAETDIILHTFSPAEQLARLAPPGSELIELAYLPNRSCLDQVRELLRDYRSTGHTVPR